jgi:hypothetical protein
VSALPGWTKEEQEIIESALIHYWNDEYFPKDVGEVLIKWQTLMGKIPMVKQPEYV